MNEISGDAELIEFLRMAAGEAGLSVQDLLRRVFHVNSICNDSEFLRIFAQVSDEISSLWGKLDYRLRVLNPGLHYVFRRTYLGYRRENATSGTPLSERSQVFLSVVPRHRSLRIVLPIDPGPYATLAGCKVLSGRGHHGIGDLLVELIDDEDLARFFRTFHDWLIDPARDT